MSSLNKIFSSSLVSLALVASISALPIVASAQSVSVGGTSGVSVGSSASSNTSANTSANTSSSVGVSVGTSGSGNATSSDNATVSSQNSTGASLETDSLGVMVSLPTQVNSSADLQVFSNNVMVKNPNVASVTTNATSTGAIEVSYKHMGHLFGIFPIWVTSTTDVSSDANGQVQVNTSMPWWNFLVTGTGNVATKVDSSLSSSASIAAAASANVSAAAKAQVIQAIVDAHAAADASANVNATTNTSVNGSASGNTSGSVQSY